MRASQCQNGDFYRGAVFEHTRSACLLVYVLKMYSMHFVSTGHRHTATDTHGDQIQRAGAAGRREARGRSRGRREGVSGIKHAGAIGFIVVTMTLYNCRH